MILDFFSHSRISWFAQSQQYYLLVFIFAYLIMTPNKQILKYQRSSKLSHFCLNFLRKVILYCVINILDDSMNLLCFLSYLSTTEYCHHWNLYSLQMMTPTNKIKMYEELTFFKKWTYQNFRLCFRKKRKKKRKRKRKKRNQKSLQNLLQLKR